MTNKHEQAQVLLDAMDQVDETMLQQAYATDSRERFRALGKLKRIKPGKDRPVSALRRWGTVAACLAVILALAASPWFFSSLLPVITPTDPTEPTLPPTTTNTTESSEPEAPIPNLCISSGVESITAYMVCGNWNHMYFDAWPSKDFHKSDKMPRLNTDLQATVAFDIPPDQTEVVCWHIDDYGADDAFYRKVETSIVDGQLVLKEGTYVYEVTATWYRNSGVNSGVNSGKVTYLFLVICGEPKYAFTEVSKDFYWPSMIYDKVSRNALKATTDSGTFYCMTDSQRTSIAFIDAQMELLNLLQKHGMEPKAMTYYVTDYDDSYSRSDESEAYIALSAVQTWKQVLVTLQAMWGDYTNYGYVYAVANNIAEVLGWQTDSVSDISEDAFTSFFLNNPDAILLEYPSFTTVYASEETVEHCKALSRFMLKGNFELHALEKPIDEQLDAWHKVRKFYARVYDIPVTGNIHGYAYCSARIPLKIKVANAEFYVDSGYVDGNEVFSDAFSDYVSIYKTVSRLYGDITLANNDWNEIYTPDTTAIYFVSEETAAKRFGSNFRVRYTEAKHGEATHTRFLTLYLYGYYKHILYQFDSDFDQIWQAQAFVELGRAKSWFVQYSYQVQFANDEASAQYFKAYAGHTYYPGLDDYFEWMDIMCYINNYFTVVYNPLATPASMGWYLTRIYGEELACTILLHPETVEAITGKTWKELEAEWAQYIKDKYADVVVPDLSGT